MLPLAIWLVCAQTLEAEVKDDEQGRDARLRRERERLGPLAPAPQRPRLSRFTLCIPPAQSLPTPTSTSSASFAATTYAPLTPTRHDVDAFLTHMRAIVARRRLFSQLLPFAGSTGFTRRSSSGTRQVAPRLEMMALHDPQNVFRCRAGRFSGWEHPFRRGGMPDVRHPTSVPLSLVAASRGILALGWVPLVLMRCWRVIISTERPRMRCTPGHVRARV